MNATLSQNVQGISIQSNEVPPLNINWTKYSNVSIE